MSDVMRVSYRETTSLATGNATVPRRLWPATIAALLSASLLGACGGGASAPPTLSKMIAAQHENVSDAQKKVVIAAAREIAGDASASVSGLTSRKKPGEPGTHVCGYVKTAASPSTPLYVELVDTSGEIVAERGQIGATPANLAKVNFMCRSHKNW